MIVCNSLSCLPGSIAFDGYGVGEKSFRVWKNLSRHTRIRVKVHAFGTFGVEEGCC